MLVFSGNYGPHMSFDLKIKLPKGYEPPVAVVEMPPLKHDRDRSPEEDRQWQLRQYERACQRAQEEAWAPFSRNIPVRGMVVVNEVLRRAGAIFRSDAPVKDKKGAKLPRGPTGEVDERKFGSNDGWLVVPKECAFIADRLKAWLDKGGEAFERAGVSWDLTPATKDKDDQATRSFLYEMAALFARASQYGGLEVW